MPAKGDHDARRRDVSDAVWGVLAEHGFGGLTMRAVAARMGASTGLVSHYFPSKKALLRHALDLAEERTAARPRQVATGPGLAALRAALLDVLPVTPELTAGSRAWVSFWDAALADPALGASQAARYDRWRTRLRTHVEAARDLGELPAATDPDQVVVIAAAFAHGLVVQALFDQAQFPPARQVDLLDRFLGTLGHPASPADSPPSG
ncbi:TetR/AcrR family transcriptional regulator [Micromonospora sp. NBC_01796]|uniref:TetR/AcrR family transcriptional regulator n=1 Tax=Micromonospora sp. NBC_01796 TaxID=2975987 RepID=UPI002DD9DFCE|nr:TetR family transcriptional regulator C-terminal domain-containing protein [Micromonospora sp. NBC_01796]WSA82974.1 TetR family transcriptional regulator C-terminal domain-containing protein [Micromonospora sp. NBC_01796]